MKESDLGLTRMAETDKTYHHPELTKWERRLIGVLGDWSKAQPDAYMPADDLAEAAGLLEYNVRKDLEAAKRNLRTLVNHLIELHDQPIVPRAGVGGGYRLAQTKPEVMAAVGPHLRRARTGLRKVSALQGTAEVLTQEMVQLALDLPGRAAVEVHRALGESLGAAAGPANLGQVKRALAAYQSDPDRYAREIEDLAEQFGGLFVRVTVLDEAEAALERAREAVARARQGTRAEAA